MRKKSLIQDTDLMIVKNAKQNPGLFVKKYRKQCRTLSKFNDVSELCILRLYNNGMGLCLKLKIQSIGKQLVHG